MNICLELRHFKEVKDAMGTERVFVSLTKGLVKLGHQVVWKVDKDCVNPLVDIVNHVPDGFICHSHEFDHKRDYSDLGKNYCITLHGGGTEVDPEWLNKLKNNKHRVITTSKFISDRVGCPVYVHNCSDEDDFTLKDKKEDYFLWIAGLNWQNHSDLDINKYAGIKGIDNKGLLFTIKLFSNLRSFRLKIAGVGDNKILNDALEKIYITYGNMEFKGGVFGDKKRDLIAKAKAVIIPSFVAEACSTTLSESLLSGTPVITSCEGGLPEQVEQVIPKIGFSCKNYSEYAKAIVGINQIHPKDCYEYGVRNFSSIASAHKHLTIYENVLKYGSVLGIKS